VCNNHTLRVKSHSAGGNCALRVEITLVLRVEITLVREPEKEFVVEFFIFEILFNK
jgi:hypothetical protein